MATSLRWCTHSAQTNMSPRRAIENGPRAGDNEPMKETTAGKVNHARGQEPQLGQENNVNHANLHQTAAYSKYWKFWIVR